jgi:signal peptidase I
MESDTLVGQPATGKAGGEDHPAAGAPSGSASPRSLRGRELLRQALITIVCGALFAVILQVSVQNYVVEGDSMWPTVLSGDRVLVDRLAYRVGTPRHGDLVVFRFPKSWARMNLIKRIIGVPGDTVEVQPGLVLVNGQPLREPYIRNVEQYWYGPERVPAGEYFVLGDNREAGGREVSYDSHQWGFLPARDIYGRVMVIYWPMSDFHLYGF